jgi:hypothetical protein
VFNPFKHESDAFKVVLASVILALAVVGIVSLVNALN